jgi:hypothetical protein
MLNRGDRVPHFQVTTTAGEVFDYSSIWQHRNLVLVVLPENAPAAASAALEEAIHSAAFDRNQNAWVITRGTVPGLQAPAALVADRWGEIVYAAGALTLDELPPPSSLFEWLDYVEQRCPECEGEAR